MAARKTYILKLYVAGNTPNSMRALNTLKGILETEFQGVYALKVIDVLKSPQLAEEEPVQILICDVNPGEIRETGTVPVIPVICTISE